MGRYASIKKFFRDNFFSGLLIVFPVGVSVYVLLKVSRWLYQKLVILPIVPERLLALLHEVLPDWAAPVAVKSVHLAEFLAVLIGLVSLIAFIGLIAKLRLVHWLLDLGESILRRIPLIGTIYSALQQLLQALFSGKGNFSQVVLVEFPRKGVWSVGFLSRELDPATAAKVGEARLFSVFIPTTPNITTGFLIMAPAADFVTVDMGIEEAFKIIMSGGMAQPHEQFDHPIERLRAAGSSGRAKSAPTVEE
jgi:uncharacterized membrane protein